MDPHHNWTKNGFNIFHLSNYGIKVRILILFHPFKTLIWYLSQVLFILPFEGKAIQFLSWGTLNWIAKVHKCCFGSLSLQGKLILLFILWFFFLCFLLFQRFSRANLIFEFVQSWIKFFIRNLSDINLLIFSQPMEAVQECVRKLIDRISSLQFVKKECCISVHAHRVWLDSTSYLNLSDDSSRIAHID